jgi:type IV pilus assembly protein PilQ
MTRIFKLAGFALCLMNMQIMAQTSVDRFVPLQNKLDSLSEHMPGLKGHVELSVSEIRLDELLRALALSHNVNMSVGEGLGQRVVSNFSQVSVKDVILFLTKKYDLEIDFSGSILSLSNYEKLPEPVVIKPIDIRFDKETGSLSFDLRNDSLLNVTKKITLLTGTNLIVPRSLSGERVSGYIKDISLKEAIEKLALINELKIRESSSGVYVFEKPEIKKNNGSRSNSKKSSRRSGELRVKVDSISDISLVAENADLQTIFEKLFEQLDQDHMIFGEIDAQITAELSHVHLDSLLGAVLNASDYTYNIKQGVYFIGERKLEGLRDMQVVAIKHRSCVELSKIIPSEIKKEVFIEELPELNSLVLEGSKVAVAQIRQFISDVDKSVPVVMIEILIIDYIKTSGMESGVEMGLAEDVIHTSGQLFPSLNTANGPQLLNKLINAFEGYGALNIGSVVPNFYVNIKAMEHNGMLDIKSTPVLTTLNGQEASLSIGTTEYYVVETNNLIGTQNPQSQKTRNWKSVKAELGVKITPNISADNNVTLAIEVNQSNFTARIEPDAPPGQVSRTFTSLIRVKDGDMILLGGLEEIKKEDTGSGVPFLSRVPLIKWFFSRRLKDKSDKKLNIFIKPTIIN